MTGASGGAETSIQASIGIGHVALTVGNVDRSAAFYADVGLWRSAQRLWGK